MSGIFGGGSKVPPPPPPKPVAPMPDEESPEIRMALSRRIAGIGARTGRGSTILTLGGDDEGNYSRGKLGG